MPPTKSKAPSFMAELLDFAGKLKDVPYERLASTFFDAGWLTQLREISATPAYNGTTLIVFDLYVGKSADTLERFDQLTMSIAPGPGPVSTAARLSARETVIFMLSGRLPPGPAPQPQPAEVPVAPVKPNGHAEPAPAEPAAGSAGDQEYVKDEAPKVSVISHREVDGLPIFRDLYEIGQPEVANTDQIIDAALDAVTEFLAEAKSVEQIAALGAKNPGLIEFFKDLGTEQDVQELKTLIDKRRNELNRPVGARRRVAAAPRAN